MATKDDMIDEIRAISADLDIKVKCNQSMRHDDLGELLSDLKAKKRDAKRVTAADAAPVGEPTKEKEVTMAESTKVMVVAEGCAICCGKKGIKDAGEVVTKDEIGTGFDNLVKKEKIVEATKKQLKEMAAEAKKEAK